MGGLRLSCGRGERSYIGNICADTRLLVGCNVKSAPIHKRRSRTARAKSGALLTTDLRRLSISFALEPICDMQRWLG
jgi:hypothetical protein